MEFVKLNNGILMPKVGLGTWNFYGEECENNVLQAVEAGYRLFDTSSMYENERSVGKALLMSGLPRDEFFISTKLNDPYTSYEKAKLGIENSLELLQTDYIDLFMIHEPYDEALEMYEALKEAYEAGKVRAIGISNFNKKRYDHFIERCGLIPQVNQIESNVFFPQIELAAHLKSCGTQPMGWAPYASDMFDIDGNPILSELADKYGKTPHQIALKFIVQHDISVVPKSEVPENLYENIDIFDFEIEEEDLALIKTIDMKHTTHSWMDDWNKGWE